MVSVAEEDRDALRFLWVDDTNKPDPNIQVFRFSRVVFGVSSSPFLLNATIDHHLKQFSDSKPDLVALLRQSIYVDDIVAGAKNEKNEAMKLYEESKVVLQMGGFNLRKLVTNMPRLQKVIDDLENIAPVFDMDSEHTDEATYAKTVLGGGQLMNPTDQKVLGLRWTVLTHCLVFSVQEIGVLADMKTPTKRKVTSTVGKFFYPLGVLSPVVIRFKIFFKELCVEGLDWDQELTGGSLLKWQSLVTSVKEAPAICIPRLYLSGIDMQSASYTLHGFCDASKEAYAAVIYLVVQVGAQDNRNLVMLLLIPLQAVLGIRRRM